jgi:hypothetical protein
MRSAHAFNFAGFSVWRYFYRLNNLQQLHRHLDSPVGSDPLAYVALVALLVCVILSNLLLIVADGTI